MTTERTYTIPLRKELNKVARYKRTNKAVVGVREFLMRHMKSEDVRIGSFLNLELWKHGRQNPPSRVRVTARKYDDGVVRVELEGKPIQEPEKEEVKKEGVTAKIKKALGVKAKAEKKEEGGAEKKPEAPKSEAKPAEKKPEAPKSEAKPAEKKPEASKAENPVSEEKSA